MTPESNTDAFLTPAQLRDYLDARIIGDLISDEGDRLGPERQDRSPRLLQVLKAASGDVEAACLSGGRYAPADLRRILDQDGVAAANLRRIAAGVAVGILHARRGVSDPAVEGIVRRAQDDLEALREGRDLFPFAEARAASLPSNISLTDADFVRGGLISTQTRYFGYRSKSLRYGDSF